MKEAFPVDTTIDLVRADTATGEIVVQTRSGGKGTATPRRGLTPHESELLVRAMGQDAAYSQATAFKVFGRIYGQGVLETPVAFQAACCLAVMDSFRKRHPGAFVSGVEDMPGKGGGCIGTHVTINDTPVAVMALVNASQGGIGPDEDLEGNIMLGDKGRAMKDLGLDRLPTIVLESKAYVPSVCRGMENDCMWIRTNGEVDNSFVYDALVSGAEAAKLPFIASDKAYPRHTGEMAEATAKMGERIVDLGKRFSQAETAARKVDIMSELALLVSQDAGGVTFMGAQMHDHVAGGGIIPGTAAVLSMAVSEPYIEEWKIPAFCPKDTEKYVRVLAGAVEKLAETAEDARRQLEDRFDFDEESYEFLFRQDEA